MHYCIATVLQQRLGLADQGFIIGNLAPDVYESSSKLKDRSHFMEEDKDGLIYIDFNLFYEKYLENNQSAFHLGYYCHLISDDIWLNEIYYKKIKWLPQSEKSKAKHAYYRDFRRLNQKLIEYYALRFVPLELQVAPVAEIDSTLLPNLIEELHEDFRLAEISESESLEILHFTEVVEVIEKTIISCLANFKKAKD